jgi:hypothetical protein
MPSSRVRREIRLFTGVNRKLWTFRWIGRQTVGVCQLVRAPRLAVVDREKAEDGAERSFRRCKRKRCRGQRRGKRRSRGDKPRSSSPRRPDAPKGVNARRINHSGRKFLWSEQRRGALCKGAPFLRFSEVLRRSRLDDGHRQEMASLLRSERMWSSWASHVRSLRRRARQVGIPDGANPFERSALDFILTNTSLGGELGFMDILSSLRNGLTPQQNADRADRSDSDSHSDHEPPPAEPPARRKAAPVKSLTGIRQRGSFVVPSRRMRGR